MILSFLQKKIKNKKQKTDRKSLGSVRSMQDIFFDSKRRFVSFKKKHWIIKINKAPFFYLLENKETVKRCAIFLLIIFMLGLFSPFTDANVSTFYPSTCLGGWEHPENAIGEPSLSQKSHIEDFTLGNSARLHQTNASLYCGGFKGSVPLNTTPKKFQLSFGWSVDDGTVVHPEVRPFEPVFNSSSTTVLTPSEVVTPTVDVETTEVEVVEITPSIDTSVETTQAPSVVEVPPAVITPETPAVVTESGPLSFLKNILLKTVFAQEIESTPAPVESSDTIQATPVDESIANTPTEQVIYLNETPEETPEVTPEVTPSPEGVINSPETNNTLLSIDSIQAPPVAVETPADAFLEVQYTLDGIEWKTLGTVSRSAWKNVTFDIPLNEWENLDHLQVSLKTLPSFDTTPTVYLDSMTLSVEYDEIQGEVVPPTVILKDASSMISGKKDFTQGDEVEFIISTPYLEVEDLKNLVKAGTAEILEDHAGVLDDRLIDLNIENQNNKSQLDIIKQSIQPTINQIIDSVPNTTSLVPSPESFVVPVVESPVEVIEITSPEALVLPVPEKESTSPTQTPVQKMTELNPLSFQPLIPRVHAQEISEASETPEITALVFDNNGEVTDIGTHIETVLVGGTEKQRVRIDKPKREFKPGRYTLKVTLMTVNATIISTQDFTWGVLAINVDKSVYQGGDDAYLQMGVLTDHGHTICNADLDLIIKTPNGATTHLTTDDKSIIRDPECGPDNVIDVPDYHAEYHVPNQVGVYEMTLTAVTMNGTKTIIDHFTVEENPLVTVSRTGPTRIYPVANYPVTLSVTSPVNWSGSIIEKVPVSFGVLQPIHSLGYDAVETQGVEKIITWHVDLQAGEKKTLGYIFDAPNISPEFYLLGPLELYAENISTPVFSESRNWQIASDAACNATGTGTWGGTDTANFANCTGAASGGTGTGNRPGAGDDLTIDAGVTVTLDVSATVNTLTIADPTTANGLSISTTRTLTVTGAVTYTANTQANAQTITMNGTGGVTAASLTIPAPTGTGSSLVTCAGSATGTFSTSGAVSITGNSTTTGAVTLGMLTCTLTVNGLLTITGGTNGTGAASVTASTGTITTSAGITFAGTAANAKFTTTGAAIHHFSGTHSAGGTVSYNGGTSFRLTGTSTLNGAYTFPAVQVNSGTTTLGVGSIVFGGGTTIANGATLTLGNFAWTMNNTISITGTLTGGTGSTGTYGFASTITVNSGGVFDLTPGTHAKTYGGASHVMNGTTWNTGTGTDTLVGTGTNTLTGSSAMTWGGTLTIPTNKTLTNSNTNTVTIGALSIANPVAANAMSLTTASTTTVTGAITYTANSTANAQTITMNGTANLNAGSLTIPAPTSTGGPRVTCAASATGTFTISGALSITGNSTTTGSVLMGMLTCTLSVTGLTTITGGSNGTGNASITSSTGVITTAGGVTFAGTAANARITTTGAGTWNNTGTISSGGTISVNANTTTVFTGTSAINGAYTLTKVTISTGTTTLGAGTITFSGTSSIANGATLSLGNFAFTMSGALTIGSGTSGTLSVAGAGNTGTYTFSNAITVNAGGIFNLSTGTHANTFSQSGTTVSHSGTTFNTGTGATSVSSSLLLAGSSAMTFGGTVTLANGATFTNGNSNTVTLAAFTLSNASSNTSLDLSTGSTTTVSGAITYNTNSGGNAQSINLNGTANLNAGSITMNAQTGTNGSQSILQAAASASGTVTVSGATTITGSASTSNFSRIDFGVSANTANFTTGSLSIVGGASSPAFLAMRTGTLTVNGNVTFSGTAANAQLTSLYATPIILNNCTMSAGGTVSITSSTVSTSGTTALNGGYTLPTLSVTGGTTTTGATTTVTGALAVANSATLSLGNFAFTASSTTTVGTGTSGIISVAGAGSTGTYTFTGNIAVNAGGTFNLSTGTHAKSYGGTSIAHSGSTFNTGTGTETITGTGTLTLSGSSAMTFGGAMAVPTNKTLTNSNTNTVTIASLNMDNPVAANNLSLTTGSNTNISGSLTFTANSTANAQTITMNGTANLTVAALSIPAPTSTGASNITCASGSGTLSVWLGSTDITGNSTSTGGVTLAMSTCTLSMKTALITGGSNGTGVAKITSSTGVITTTSGISFAGTAANAQITTTGAGTINLTGAAINSGGTLSINSATDLVSTGTSSIYDTRTFGIVHVNSGTLTLRGAETFAGALTIGSGATLMFDGYAFTASSTTDVSGSLLCPTAATCTGLKTFSGLVTNMSGGTIDLTPASVVATTEFRGGITADSGALVTDFGTGSTIFTTSDQSLSGPEPITFGGTVTLSSNLNLDMNTMLVYMNNLYIERGDTTVNILDSGLALTGDIDFEANAMAGTAQRIRLDAGGNIVADRITMPATTSTGTATIDCTSGSYGTVTTTGPLSITGSSTASGGTSSIDFGTTASSCALYTEAGLTLAGGSTGIASFVMGDGGATLYGNVTFGTAGNITRSIISDVSSGTNFNLGLGSFGPYGTVTFNSATVTNVFDVESIDGSYAFEEFVMYADTTLGADVSVLGNLSVTSGTTLMLGGFLFTVLGTTGVDGTITCPVAATCTGLKTFSGQMSINSGGLVDLAPGSVDPSLEFNNGIFAHISSSASINFGTGATVFSGNQSLTGAQYMTFNGPVTVGGFATTLTNSVTSRRVTFGDTVDGFNSSAVFATGAGSITRFRSMVMTTGNLVPSASAHDIEMDSNNANLKSPTTNPYYNLIVGSSTRTSDGAVSVSNTLTLTGGTVDTNSSFNYALTIKDLALTSGTLAGNASTITVTGNWTNSGTFTAGTSTVLMNGGATTTVTGTTSFYNLTITHTGAKQVNFATSGAPVFTITGTFTATGHVGALVKLYSDASPTQWHFHPTGTASVDYVEAKDSVCDSGSVQVSKTNFTDGLNNGFCWIDAALSFDINDETIGFGSLSTSAARYATGDTLGSASEVEAHNFTVNAISPGGYVVTAYGPSLTRIGSADVVTAIGGTNTASSAGTSQFGLRMTATGGTGAVTAPYAASGFAYDGVSNPSQVCSATTGDGVTTTYSVRYLGNISPVTAGGEYSTSITYIATGTF